MNGSTEMPGDPKSMDSMQCLLQFCGNFFMGKGVRYYIIKKKARSFEHTWKYLHRWKKLHHLTLRSAFVPTNLSGKGCLIHLNG